MRESFILGGRTGEGQGGPWPCHRDKDPGGKPIGLGAAGAFLSTDVLFLMI